MYTRSSSVPTSSKREHRGAAMAVGAAKSRSGNGQHEINADPPSGLMRVLEKRRVARAVPRGYRIEIQGKRARAQGRAPERMVHSNQTGQTNGGFEPAAPVQTRSEVILKTISNRAPPRRPRLRAANKWRAHCALRVGTDSACERAQQPNGRGPQPVAVEATQCKPADRRERSNPFQELGLECRETQTQARSP